MFSAERINSILITNEKSYFKSSFSWNEILKEIILIVYFKEHLNKHLLENFKLTIVIDHSLNLETVYLLILLEKKYDFLNLKQLNILNVQNDLDYKLKVNSANNILNLNSSTLCLLIGTNTRLESSTLNIKLRQRFLKGNFKIFSINSFFDLTFPYENLGSNINIFKNIIEGNHFFCQELKKAKNPLIIYNSNIFSRHDAKIFSLMLDTLNNTLKIYNYNWNGINCINSSINELGLNLIGTLKSFNKSDFLKSSGLYFVQSNINSNNILKLLELKLLKYFKTENYLNKFLIDQNSVSIRNLKTFQLKKFNVSTFIELPSKNFFEDSGIYLNSEGIYKKTIKIIPAINNSKSNWQILRKIFSNLDNNIFLNKEKVKLIFNFTNYNIFLKYINFHYFASTALNLFNLPGLNYKSNNLIFPKNIYKKKFNKKLYKTKINLWIDDFYLGNKDPYSKFSKTMILMKRR